MPVARWRRGLAVAGVLLCFIVVVLGASVRLTAAGLGCPDWPGCYGHITPSGAGHGAAAQAAYAGRPLALGKAWREMLHRYAAGALVLVILGVTALAISARGARPVSLPFTLALLATVIVQALLGMLTVTWQLKPLIVTLHLLFGLTTLGLLWWLMLSLPSSSWGATALKSAGRKISGGGGGRGAGGPPPPPPPPPPRPPPRARPGGGARRRAPGRRPPRAPRPPGGR